MRKIDRSRTSNRNNNRTRSQMRRMKVNKHNVSSKRLQEMMMPGSLKWLSKS
jgi:hypothetical protein